MSPRKHTFRRGLILAVSALLLVAQLGAVMHAVWHAAQRAPVGDRVVRAGDTTRSPTTPDVAKLCVFDAVLGQLLGGAAAATQALALHATADLLVPAAGNHLSAAEVPSPRSRGPPALL